MTDHFAVLRQPRRPWLDSDQLKQEYQQLSFTLHPDRKKLDDVQVSDFAAVTEAYRVLSSPRLRLRHLLELNNDGAANFKTSDVSSELTEIFMEAATLVLDIDRHLQKQEQTASTLGKSLLGPGRAKFQKRVQGLLEQLQQSYDDAVEQLRRADELWETDCAKAADLLRTLADRFAYLERWIGQLREKQFQLAG